MMRPRAVARWLVQVVLPKRVSQIIRKEYYVWRLSTYPEQNEPDLSVVKHLVRQGDYVVDIGANFGVYTKFMSEWVGRRGRVYSVEPIPQTYEILCNNISRLDLGNVEAIQCAISNQAGHVTMEIPVSATGENFYRARVVNPTEAESLRPTRVEAKTLDSLFLQTIPQISFIKCDAEGHELYCLQGALGILKEQKPIWMIEVTGDPDNPQTEAYNTFAMLAEQTYHAYWFDGRSLYKRRIREQSSNYFFLTPDHVRLLQAEFSVLVA